MGTANTQAMGTPLTLLTSRVGPHPEAGTAFVVHAVERVAPVCRLKQDDTSPGRRREPKSCSVRRPAVRPIATPSFWLQGVSGPQNPGGSPRLSVVTVAMDDATLAAMFASGDSDTIRVVYQTYGRLVFSVAYRVLGDVGLAEDATQQTFVKAWRAAATYDPSQGAGRLADDHRQARGHRRLSA